MNIPCPINCKGKELSFESTVIMGIVNTTPDSFYDGGHYQDRALDHARSLIRAGASIIDIGGESTRPGAENVCPEEELRRTIPLIRQLRKETDIPLSIDTWKSEVAEEALKAGADIVNDISGFSFDPMLPDVCRRHRSAVVLMHTPAKPGKMKWSTDTLPEQRDIVTVVQNALMRSVSTALEHDIENIIIDPGFGFGKSVEENFLLLSRIGELCQSGYPVLAGLSRKSFLGNAIASPDEPVPPPSQRLYATIAANTIAVMNGAAVLRVHDVTEARHAAAIARAVSRK
nr:dihydropteroate synthase [Prosthecochloris sp. HL-130-GSB]